MMHIFGDSYDARLDHDRLRNNTQRVFKLLLDGKWHGPAHLRPVGGSAWDSRVRGLRHAQFGSIIVESRRRDGGAWEYRLDLDSLTKASYERVVEWDIARDAAPTAAARCCPVCKGTGKLLNKALKGQMDLFVNGGL